MPARNSPPLGKRQIFKAELWDLDFVDIIFLMSSRTIRTKGGELVSDMVYSDLDLCCGLMRCTSPGTSNEVDAISFTGSARLKQPGSPAAEIPYHLGDKPIFKARQW